MSKNEAKEIILSSDYEDKLLEAVHCLEGKWKRESPKFLERLLSFDDDYLLFGVIRLLAEYRHPLAKEYLIKLSHSVDEDVREYAQKYL